MKILKNYKKHQHVSKEKKEETEEKYEEEPEENTITHIFSYI